MRSFLLSAVLALSAASAASAATLQVALNHTTRLQLAGHAASVVVGNPAIADVTVVDSRNLFVSGRGFGTTDVTVIDALGRTLYSGEVSVTPAGAAVSVFRDAARAELACAPACASSTPQASLQATGSSAQGATAAAAGQGAGVVPAVVSAPVVIPKPS